MWLTDVMEIQFAGALLALAVDLGARRYGRYRAYVAGGVAAAALLASLCEFLWNWSRVLAATLTATPVLSVFASLYSVDRLGMLVILTVLLVALAVAIHSAMSFRPDESAGPFFGLLGLAVTSAVGVVSSGDLLTLFLFWEATSVAAYGLVSFERSTLSLEAAMKYFFMAGTGALIYLYGVALVFSVTGSIRLDTLPSLLQHGGYGVFSVLMLVAGLGVEAALFPFHTWLPDAYGAAPPQAGALNGRVVDEVLLFAILKVLQPFLHSAGVEGLQATLAVFAVLTMLVGNLGALRQTNLRRMLAFSSVAQHGYMLAALSTFTPLGLIAVVFHIWNHGLVKSNFFLLTGTAGREYEAADLERMRGVGQEHRVLGILFASSSLAMVGSPPFGMFWSELLIVQSLLSVGSTLFLGLGATVVLNVFLSIGYYYRVVNTLALTSDGGERRPFERRLLLPPLALLALSLLTGVLPSVVLQMIS